MKLADIHELIAAATPGPWDYEYGVTQRLAWQLERWAQPVSEPILYLDSEKNCDLDGKQVCANMDFIAASRKLMPKFFKLAKAMKVYMHGPYEDGKNPEDLLADIYDAFEEIEQ